MTRDGDELRHLHEGAVTMTVGAVVMMTEGVVTGVMTGVGTTREVTTEVVTEEMIEIDEVVGMMIGEGMIGRSTTTDVTIDEAVTMTEEAATTTEGKLNTVVTTEGKKFSSVPIESTPEQIFI